MKTKTTLEFVEQARVKHGFKYNYSKVNYRNAKTKVCIICPEHGEFLQSPDLHLSGRGCKECADIRTGNSSRGNLETFVSKARLVHGDKYDYSKVVYTRAIDKVIIVCPEHGDFSQTPNAHLSNHGCAMCSGKNTRDRKLTEGVASFELSRRVGFDYSKAIYVDAKTPVEIVCEKHGSFWQTPDSHQQGKGCQTCGAHCSGGPSRAEDEIAEWLIGLGENVLRSQRKIIPPKEIDIWLPEHNLGIEYHGLYWHTEDRVGNLHAEKHRMAKEVGGEVNTDLRR